MIKRETKFSNEMLYNLLRDYTVTEIKMFSCILNKLLSKYKALTNENNLNLGDEDETDLPEEIFEIGISLDFFKEYGKLSKISKNQIMDCINSISSLGIWIINKESYIRKNIIKEIEYNSRYKSIRITFNEDNIKYLVLVYKQFTLIDINDLKQISSKYELGLYILIKMFYKTGKLIKTPDGFKDFFGVGGKTNDLTKYMQVALLKLNSKFNFNAIMEYEKIDKRIDKVIIKFRRNQNEK